MFFEVHAQSASAYVCNSIARSELPRGSRCPRCVLIASPDDVSVQLPVDIIKLNRGDAVTRFPFIIHGPDVYWVLIIRQWCIAIILVIRHVVFFVLGTVRIDVLIRLNVRLPVWALIVLRIKMLFLIHRYFWVWLAAIRSIVHYLGSEYLPLLWFLVLRTFRIGGDVPSFATFVTS